MMMKSFDTKQFYTVLALSLVCFVFVLSSIIVLSVPLPLGSDAYFHLDLSRLLGTGNFTGWWNEMFTVNKYFYPPLYHIIILPVSIGPDPYTGLRLLEMVFMPITFACVAWITWKISGPKAALITGLILIGSWSFVDGALQARPESIDLLFIPLIIYAALYNRKKWFAGLASVTIYGHGFAALSGIFGIAVRKMREPQWRKTLLLATLIILPMIIIGLYYIGGAWTKWATMSPSENPQEVLFWTKPWPWIPFYSGITLFGWLFIFKRNKTEPEKLLTWTLIGNLLMLPLWADRWLQYSVIPLTMLMGIEFSRWHGWKLYLILTIVTVVTLTYVSLFLFISITGQWWQPGRFITPIYGNGK